MTSTILFDLRRESVVADVSAGVFGTDRFLASMRRTILEAGWLLEECSDPLREVRSDMVELDWDITPPAPPAADGK